MVEVEEGAPGADNLPYCPRAGRIAGVAETRSPQRARRVRMVRVVVPSRFVYAAGKLSYYRQPSSDVFGGNE